LGSIATGALDDEPRQGLLGPGRGVLFFVGVLLVAVYLAGCFSYLVHTRSQGILLGYRLGRARARQIELSEHNRQLQIEARVWRTPERLQAEARRTLALQPIEGEQVLYLPDVQPAGVTTPPPGATQDPLALLRQAQQRKER